MQEEDFIRQITEGADNPFRVPEGYFDSLTDRVMSRLPARTKSASDSLLQTTPEGLKRDSRGFSEAIPTVGLKRDSRGLQPTVGFRLSYVWRYAAVLLVAFGVGLTFLLHSRHEQRLAESDTAVEYQEDYINDVFDYAMISSSDIELYLTEAQ